MSWQHFDPPAIIIPAPPRAEVQIPSKKESITAEKHFRRVFDKPWNKVQEDGKINIDGQSSASISPYSEHFRSQVEDGIWPLVESLFKAGYMPVSSCAGHRGNLFQELETLFTYRSEPYVTIALHRSFEESTMLALQELSNEHTQITVTHSQANMDASGGRIRKRDVNDIKNEYWSLNWMLQRNYDEWSYITIRINPWKRLNLSHVLRTQKEQQLINELAENYKRLPHYIF